METLDPIRYPIGQYTAPTNLSREQRSHHIQTIQEFPDRLSDLVRLSGESALGVSYRPGGWTLLQIVHHCADSHMNAYIRHKLTATEDNPTVKPYEENDWARLPDASTLPPDASLRLLEGLYSRWAAFLRSVPEPDWQRTFYHPETQKTVPLFESLAHYAWHCEHHLGHVRGCIERAGR